MPRDIGTGISELGQTVQAFGLQMLTEGIAEEKRVAAMQKFEELRTYLESKIETGEITEDDAVDAMHEANTDLHAGLNALTEEAPPEYMTAEEEAVAKPMGAGARALAAGPAAAAAVEEPPAPEMKPPERTGLAGVYAPYAEKYGRFQEVLKSPEYVRLKKAAVSAGVDPGTIMQFEEKTGGGITSAGQQAVTTAFQERRLELREEEIGVKREDIERKREFQEKQYKLQSSLAKLKGYWNQENIQLKRARLLLDKTDTTWRREIAQRKDLPRKLKELDNFILNSDDAIKFDKSYSEMKKIKGSGYVKDIFGADYERVFTEAGTKLKDDIKLAKKRRREIINRMGEAEYNLYRQREGVTEPEEGGVKKKVKESFERDYGKEYAF